MIPGVMADARSYATVFDTFDRPEPVLILNRRGRSPSGDLGEHYSIDAEVADLRAWVDHLGTSVTLMGWSYGATIALEAAAAGYTSHPVLAYEPVLAPFGADALPALANATPERAVHIVNVDISRFPPSRVDQLRDSPAWADLVRLAVPLRAELQALNDFEPSPWWKEVRAELILGELNRGSEPYGRAFERVARLLPHARTHLLSGQGHLAHVEAPADLGRILAGLLP